MITYYIANKQTPSLNTFNIFNYFKIKVISYVFEGIIEYIYKLWVKFVRYS